MMTYALLLIFSGYHETSPISIPMQNQEICESNLKLMTGIYKDAWHYPKPKIIAAECIETMGKY